LPDGGYLKIWAISLIAAVIALPCRGQTVAAEQPFGPAEKRAVIEKAGELLVANYIDPARAAEAKHRLDTALAAGAYDPATTPEEFAEELTSDLRSVTQDRHLRVFPPPRPQDKAAPAVTTVAEHAYAGFSRVDRLKGNIGYIKLVNIPDPAGPFSETAAKAFADLAGTSALIIDMRDNRGGSFDGVIYLCSFFFDPKKPVHIDGSVSREPGTDAFVSEEFYTRPVPVFYGKPAYLLTSKRTASAGEKFLYDLQAQKRARLIGEATSGSANGTAGHPLPFQFSIGIPYQRTVNPVTRTNFEGAGVIPDLAVDESLSLQAALHEIAMTGKYPALQVQPQNPNTEEELVEAKLLQFRDQQQPGGAAAVRNLFAGIAAGRPDYTKMSGTVAEVVKNDLDFFHADMSRLGEARSVTFSGVDSSGRDNYEVTTATHTERFAIYLGPDGKIVTAGFYPPRPLSQRGSSELPIRNPSTPLAH
jgi:hypothetical protein